MYPSGLLGRLCLTGMLLSASASARADDGLASWDGRVELPQRTEVVSKAGKKRLLKTHQLTLQWVSWEKGDRGQLRVEEAEGRLTLWGEQRDPKTGNFVRLIGVVERIKRRRFSFVGRIVTQVDHIAGGVPCTREGRMTFRISGKRAYWRLKENSNPCSEVTDYVDLHFDKGR